MSLGDACGGSGAEHLVTLGWERAGGLVTLFAPPWGPKSPTLATPQFLFASNPTDSEDADDYFRWRWAQPAPIRDNNGCSGGARIGR